MTNFIDKFSDTFDLNQADTHSVLSSLKNECVAISAGDNLDYIELFLAAALNAKLRGVTQDLRYKKFKFLLNNNNRRAVDIGNRWMDGKISFELMLSIV